MHVHIHIQIRMHEHVDVILLPALLKFTRVVWLFDILMHVHLLMPVHVHIQMCMHVRTCPHAHAHACTSTPKHKPYQKNFKKINSFHFLRRYSANKWHTIAENKFTHTHTMHTQSTSSIKNIFFLKELIYFFFMEMCARTHTHAYSRIKNNFLKKELHSFSWRCARARTRMHIAISKIIFLKRN